MTGLRVPFRLARREVMRRPGRTALVALLIALPVTAMALSITLIRTGQLTPLQEWSRHFGQADAVAFDDATVSTGLPEGTRSVAVASVSLRALSEAGRRSTMDVSDIPIDDPIAAGVHDLVAGRAPVAPGEVALSTSLARRFGVTLNDDLVLVRPDLRWHVVGLVEPVRCLGCDAAIVSPGEVPASDRFEPSTVRLVDLPVMSSTALDRLQRDVPTLEIRNVAIAAATQAGSAEGVRWSLVLGAVALTVAGIVISAAFAVGARRQLVTIGQLSASGASPATVRAALVLQGSITGVLGALAGLGLWWLVLVRGRGVIERYLDMRVDHFLVRPVEIAGAATIGVVAATVAALVPARTAAGIPTLAALSGHRPIVPVSRRQVSRGLVLFVGGLALLGLAALGSNGGSSPSYDASTSQVWMFVAVLGGVSELLGACALAPLIVARLEPLAARLRGSWRLGARSLARHRSRTGAVVSAVSAAGALAVMAAALLLGARFSEGDYLQIPDDVVVLSAIAPSTQDGAPQVLQPAGDAQRSDMRVLLPGVVETTLRATTRPSSPEGYASWIVGLRDQSVIGVSQGFDQAVVAEPEALEAVRATASVRAALADTGIVLLSAGGQGELPAGPAVATLPDGRAAAAAVVHHRYTLSYGSSLLISPARATALHLSVEPFASVFVSPTPVSDLQRDGLEDIQFDQGIGPDGSSLEVSWAYPHTGPTTFQVELILTGVALLFSLFVVGVSLALAAAESKDERDVLTIAGAPPGALARSAGARAWLLASIGGAMAIPVGFLPVVVFVKAREAGTNGDPLPIVFPTRTALLLVLGVPCLVALAAWMTSGAAQALRPVRVSTATFE